MCPCGICKFNDNQQNDFEFFEYAQSFKYVCQRCICETTPNGNIVVHCGEQWNGNNQADVRAYNIVPAFSSNDKEDEGSDAWKNVAKFTPVLQTLLWMIFASYVIYMFRSTLNNLATSVGKRIDNGADVDTKWGSLKGGVRPQSATEQVDRLDRKIQEANRDIPAPPDLRGTTEFRNTPPVSSDKFLRAEDLAIRALQVHYSVPIARNVKAGNDFPMDGYFEIGGKAFVIEVKLVTERVELQNIIRSVDRILHAIQIQGWTNSILILALVLETEGEWNAMRKLRRLLADYGDRIEVKPYVLRELERRFEAEA